MLELLKISQEQMYQILKLLYLIESHNESDGRGHMQFTISNLEIRIRLPSVRVSTKPIFEYRSLIPLWAVVVLESPKTAVQCHFYLLVQNRF